MFSTAEAVTVTEPFFTVTVVLAVVALPNAAFSAGSAVQVLKR